MPCTSSMTNPTLTLHCSLDELVVGGTPEGTLVFSLNI